MRITFLGGGNMASALIGGLVKTGFSAADIAVIEVGAQGRAKLRLMYGVRCYEAPTAAALDCDALLLSVKPQQMHDACASLPKRLKQQLVISIAAGLRLADIARWLDGYAKIVRAMPNTPALIGAGITGLCALPAVSMAERLGAERILQAVGSTLWVADEAQMDAVTAVSGSGPALIFAHGLGGNHLSWWQQVAHFAPRYTCVTFAHRGFAPSDAVAGGVDPADYAVAASGVIFPNPNAPTSIGMDLEGVKAILRAQPNRVVIVDEAYIDFGGQSAIPLVSQYPNLVVVHTFSKSRSLAGLRASFAVASPGSDRIESAEVARASVNPRMARAPKTAAIATTAVTSTDRTDTTDHG